MGRKAYVTSLVSLSLLIRLCGTGLLLLSESPKCQNCWYLM